MMEKRSEAVCITKHLSKVQLLSLRPYVAARAKQYEQKSRRKPSFSTVQLWYLVAWNRYLNGPPLSLLRKYIKT